MRLPLGKNLLVLPRRRRLASLASLAAVGLLSSCDRAEPRERVVLITLDTLRWDRFDHETMPNLARRAFGSTVFEHSYSATSSTQPTHASLFTGLHPWQHGVLRNGGVMDAELVTVAELLRDAGFHTAAVVASFPLHSRFGFSQGFDVYDDDFGEADRARRWSGQEVLDGFYDLATAVADSAIALIDAAPQRDQFFWFHFYDPHPPYGDSRGAGEALPMERLRRAVESAPAEVPGLLRRARQLYDVDVRYMDEAIEKILERLDRDAGRFETHIVVTADHGESFGEGGSIGHGKRLIPSQIRVPLVLISPQLEPGTRQDPTGSVDVAATLLALAGLPIPPGSFGRDLRGARSHDGEPVCGMRRTFAKPYRDVRIGGEAVIVDAPNFYCVEDGRLYIGDAHAVTEAEGRDPGARGSRLRERFRSFAAEAARRPMREHLDADTQRALEALGYVR